ncbi:MAG: dotP [Gammaproteobacteria bacterium]|jgi:intracellular multiplication protein IcmD|nr:dotP [Gammaproteobacteria bacterium]
MQLNFFTLGTLSMRSLLLRVGKFTLGIIAGILFCTTCFADTSTISGIVSNMENEMLEPIFNVIISIAYLAGAGFVVAAIFKFKAHKDNPTQVTVGTPIMLLFVGIGLLFLPAIITSVMHSIGFSSSGAGSVTFSSGTIFSQGS